MNKLTNLREPGQTPKDSSPVAAGSTGLSPMNEARLWQNPCWFAFRLNYLALCYNRPLYGWVKRTFGLSRPEFVVIYSLGLLDGILASDISSSAGFPKNTLSRAIARLAKLDLIDRRTDPRDKRRQSLHLTAAGQQIFDEALPSFVAIEQRMLQTLNDGERATLSRLLAKIVLDSVNWAPNMPEFDRLLGVSETGEDADANEDF